MIRSRSRIRRTIGSRLAPLGLAVLVAAGVHAGSAQANSLDADAVAAAAAAIAPSGVALGKEAHQLASSSAASRGSYAGGNVRLIPNQYTTEGHVGDILRWANGRVRNCQLVHRGTGNVDWTGAFDIWVAARYPNGEMTNPQRFVASFARPVDEEAKLVLAGAGERYFMQCVKNSYPADGSVLNDGKRHVDQLVPALNSRLEKCTLRVVGKVGEPDSDGNFRFYLEAVYTDGRVDPKVHFETNHKNVMTTEIKDFLSLIPSQAFSGCKHRNGGPDPDPNPDPDPDPDPNPRPDAAAVKRHIGSILFFMNDKLDKCTLEQEGEADPAGADGYADYYLNAKYADGTRDTRRKFRVNPNVAIETHVRDLLEVIPTAAFRKCRMRGGSDPDPDPRPDQLKRHIQSVLTKVNAKLEACTVVADGDPGPIGGDGFAEFHVNARYTDGSTDTRKKFRTSLQVSADAQATELLEMIPTQIFRKCRVRGGSDPDPDPNPDPDPDPDPRPDQAAAREHIAGVLALLNDSLENCIVALSGRVSPVDEHGNFFHYLVAYVRADGAFTDAVRFQSNLHQPKEAELSVLKRLIPTVEFKKCRHRN